MANGLPAAIPLRDVELVVGGGLTITGALTVFRATSKAQTPLDTGLLLGLGLMAVGLYLLYDASRRRP